MPSARTTGGPGILGIPVPFAVILPYRGTRKRTQRLAVTVSADDDGSPCVTVGFPADF